jgi:class 3 adenylate cyclase/tetratricopeptide (TPR) repeat protein
VDIAEWLRGLGLGQYVPAFAENEVDWQILPRLTADDLKEMGVVAIGHRRRLLDAIANLSAPEASPPAPPATVAGGAERRQLTVMFCDLVGSTALAGRLDPEDLREVIGAYHATVAEKAERFGGFVAKYMGDGVLLYFGYPHAQEDDAERAVRAGLALAECVPALDTAARLQTRIGIATGLVIVGDLLGEGAAQERGVVGETPNLAARLQGMAEPNTLLIGETTRRLVGDLFECRDLGAVGLRGIAEPVPAWQVLRPSAIESRFEAMHATTLSPLIGREEELDLLLRRWQRAAAGEGQVVLLSGEPGIGKSRLSAALQEQLAGGAHTRLRYFCSPHHRDSALYPFIAQLERAAGFERDGTASARLDKLEALVAPSANNASETAALFADLLGIATEGRYPALPQDPQRRRELTLSALLGQLEGLARRQPVLLLFDDAHWADSTSLELLDRAIERLGHLPVLMILTSRPEFAPPWVGQARVTSLALNRLGGREAAALAGSVAGGKPLPKEILDRIVERTDGIPLFVEELTKSLLESGLLREEAAGYALAGPLPPLAIPSSLRDSLMARLDRLAPVKEVAQIGAAIGREFSYELLAAVARRGDTELRSALDQLTEAGLVFRRGTPPRATFIFKHALVQDAAYSTLLRAQRQELHARIAKVLEERFPETADTQPEVLARHCAEAGLTEKSLGYWEKAGQRSVARAALTEATAQYQKGLDELALMPDSRWRQLKELELRAALGPVLRLSRGQVAAEVGANGARARDLWEQLGCPPEFLHIAYTQARYHSFRRELGLGLRLGRDLIRLSRQHSNSAGLFLGHLSCGQTLEVHGQFAESRSHLEEALSCYDPVAHQSLFHLASSHPQVIAKASLGLTLSFLGFAEQASISGNAAVDEARRLAHPPTLAITFAFSTNRLLLAGATKALAQLSEELVRIANEEGYPHYRGQGLIYLGWSKIAKGNLLEGVPVLRAGLSAYRQTGATGRISFYMLLLSRACEMDGHIDEALNLLDEPFQIVETGERWVEAELYRQKGQLLLHKSDAVAAEQHYRKAIGIAREQEARLWEVRAATSLARLWGDQGRRAEARDLLAPVYGWFTEGFDTADLTDAKAVLAELS